MIGIIIIIAIFALLWFGIDCAESKLPSMSTVWNAPCLTFALICVFLLVALLQALINEPIIRF